LSCTQLLHRRCRRNIARGLRRDVPHLYAVARERYQRAMNPGPFGINSRVALVGEKIAEAMGCGSAFHDAVMNAYWGRSA
jgi:hypothetical protein